MEQLSGGDMLIRALHDEGVEIVFGYPGGAVLHIYDAIFRQDNVEHILVRHEQAATHAADGYARSTGKPGVVLVTSGPGATNAITGIATAYMDSIPMIVISGQVESRMIGSDAFQETDMVGVSRPIVKHSFMVQHASEIPTIVKKAFHLATTGRPGPVVIDVPKDVTDPTTKFPYEYPKEVKMRSYQVPGKGHSGQIKKAVEALLTAKRPMIYAGGGVIQGGVGKVKQPDSQAADQDDQQNDHDPGRISCKDRFAWLIRHNLCSRSILIRKVNYSRPGGRLSIFPRKGS